MGFSKTPLEKIDDAADVLRAIKILSDKDTLEKTIKEAHALDAAEAAKAAEARDKIVHYEGLIADNLKQKTALDAFYASLTADRKSFEGEKEKFQSDIAAKNAEISASMDVIRNENLKLDARKLVLDSDASQNAAAKKEVFDIKSGLQKEREQIERDRAAVLSTRKEADELMAKAVAKAARIAAEIES